MSPADRVDPVVGRTGARFGKLAQAPRRGGAGDLAQDGGVVVHDTSGPDGPDATLVQRVLDGLRRL